MSADEPNVIPIESARKASGEGPPKPRSASDRLLALMRESPLRRSPAGLVILDGERVIPVPSEAFIEHVRAAWCEAYPDATLGDATIGRALATVRADKSIPETDRRPPPPKPRRVPTEPREVLRESLTVDRSGDVRDCLANVLSILSADPEWFGVIAYDAFKEGPVVLKPPPQRGHDRVPDAAPGSDWTEQDSTRTAAWIADTYGAHVSSRTVTEAVMAIAQRTVVHPPCDYLDRLRREKSWDRKPRVDSFFPDYCGSSAGEYSAGIARILFLSAVARVRKPGCKVDTIPILESKQGGFKSSLVSALFSPWSSDTPLPIGDKDAYQQLRSVWGYELAELAAFKGRDATRIKSFASSPTDTYRPSFERRSRPVPRQCVFIGTTNEEQYLDDATGARRFLPLHVPRIDLEAIRRDRDQLWAEADARFEQGEPWWPTKALERHIATHTEERYVSDPWEDKIRTWLARPVRLHVEEGGTKTEELEAAHGFTMAVILECAVGVPVARQGKAEQDRASKILRRASWRRGRQERDGNAVIRRWHRAERALADRAGDGPGDGPGDRGKQP